MNIKTLRQTWLMKAIDILRHDFNQIGETFPGEIDILVEYPGQGYQIFWLGSHRITDNRCYIFINPTVDGLLALDTLVHELVHAAVFKTEGHGHGERFHYVAKAIGLDDRGIYAGAEESLLKRLREIQETLGSYPVDCLEGLGNDRR